MQALIHTLNIGTLATWLSVAGLGTVAVVTPVAKQPAPEPVVVEESSLFDDDFIIGDVAPAAASESNSTSVATRDAIPAEMLPSPPELEPLAELTPLPEIPALPLANSAKPVESRTRSAEATRQASGRTDSAAAGSATSSARRSSGGLAGAGTSSSGGMSESARLAAGRMPAPGYPAECRRKGQTGTVVVEFIVDANGRVISAYAKSESPWPLLNNEAVRTVRKWKFPPGGIMKVQRPIVFQLR